MSARTFLGDCFTVLFLPPDPHDGFSRLESPLLARRETGRGDQKQAWEPAWPCPSSHQPWRGRAGCGNGSKAHSNPRLGTSRSLQAVASGGDGSGHRMPRGGVRLQEWRCPSVLSTSSAWPSFLGEPQHCRTECIPASTWLQDTLPPTPTMPGLLLGWDGSDSSNANPGLCQICFIGTDKIGHRSQTGCWQLCVPCSHPSQPPGQEGVWAPVSQGSPPCLDRGRPTPQETRRVAASL